MVNKTQWEKIQRLIKAGIDEGATLVTGGVGRPEGLDKGRRKPTVLRQGGTNEMTIAKEEIFGPVVLDPGLRQRSAKAVDIGNDTRNMAWRPTSPARIEGPEIRGWGAATS